MATISDVAEKAGVSKGTVSAVLNNRKTGPIKVSHETWEKVLVAAAALSYTPNTAARGLRTGRTYLIGVITGEVKSSFVSEILDGIENILNDKNYNIILVKNKKPGDIPEKCRFLNEKKVDGLIVISNMYEDYTGYFTKISFSKPVVFIANNVNMPDIGSVSVNGFKIGFLAAEYLLRLGHRRIAVAEVFGSDRIDGVLKAFSENGIPSGNLVVLEKYSSFEDGRAALDEIIENHPEVTAVIAHSDIVASGIIYEAREKEISIPGQLSIIGIDNIEMSKMLFPSLTTVHQPKSEQGMLAAELVFNMIEGKASENIRLNPNIVGRNSCAVPRKERMIK
ncbi:MAG: hypothetical protein A2020_15270 [Lentisphaerae bacterium GWF2_45_14]|nr:MAG: hypothetical protein A2020_15270 [Lentisphaerae bacterium GWF2_45_14]